MLCRNVKKTRPLTPPCIASRSRAVTASGSRVEPDVQYNAVRLFVASVSGSAAVLFCLARHDPSFLSRKARSVSATHVCVPITSPTLSFCQYVFPCFLYRCPTAACEGGENSSCLTGTGPVCGTCTGAYVYSLIFQRCSSCEFPTAIYVLIILAYTLLQNGILAVCSPLLPFLDNARSPFPRRG